MAGRNHMPRHLMNDELHGSQGGRPFLLPRGCPMMPLHPLEEKLVMQREDIQRLIDDNRHLVDEHVALRREVAAARDELHRLSEAIPKLRADKEAQARDLIQRGLKMEAELRALEPLKSEVSQLQTEAQKLDALWREMTAKINGLSKDLKQLEAENKQIPALRADIDNLRQELVRTRTGYEYEKKANAEQIEHRQAMENNLISMAREIEKLRAEQVGREKRVGGPGGVGYGELMGPDMGYPSAFGDRYNSEKGLYGAGRRATYELHGLPHH